MARRVPPILPVAAAAVLVASFVATTAAEARPTQKAHPAQSHRSVSKYATSTQLPKSVKHASAGAVNLGEDGTLQHYVNRSNSPRPAIVRRNGARVLAHQAAATSWLPRVAATPVVAGRAKVTKSWEGLNEYDNGVYAGFSLEPPDQGMCAGSGNVLELINDTVQVFGTNGKAKHAPVYLNDFFNEPGYQFTTDPSCVYDAGSGRFIADQLTLDTDPNTGNLTGRTWVDIAVSKSGNALGAWNFYRVYTTDDGTDRTPTHTDCPCIGDFPHIGTDANGVYLTVNEYPFDGAGVFGNGFNGVQLYALSKSAVTSGRSNVTVTQFQNLRIPTTSGARLTGFTLWPAQAAGNAYDTANNGTMPFLSSLAAAEARPDDFTGHANQIAYWQLRNTVSLGSGTPSLSLGVRRLTVGDYGLPPLSNQKAGPVPLRDCLTVGCVDGLNDQYAPEQEGGFDSSDTRMLTAGYANGRVFGALDTALQVAGNVEAGVEYFSVNVTRSTPSLIGNGYVGVAHNNVSYPAIATDKSGHGYYGVTLSGDNHYPSAAYGTWQPSGPGSAIRVAAAGQAPEDGFCEYLYFNCGQTATPSIRPRWGDYGYAAWDGTEFFVANEYIAHSCSFSEFNADHTCGGTRTFYGNFSTRITKLAAGSS